MLNLTERWDRVIGCVVLHESDAPSPAGTYIYAFSLAIPATAAPSCASGLGFIEYAVQAIAVRSGVLGGDVRDSAPLVVAVNPSGAHSPVRSFSHHAEGQHPDTGVCRHL